MHNENHYIKKLESVIKQMLVPIKDVPFNLVIEHLSGHRVLKFDRSNNRNKALLKDLIEATKLAGASINKRGIKRSRPNEVGNDMEIFLIDAFKKIGYKAGTPTTSGGKKKVVGYPDIEVIDNLGTTHYVEAKTFNLENVGTTQRSFYFSPSTEFKVSKDAYHFVISFEAAVSGRRGCNNLYMVKSWKILSIEELPVDVKYEFNSDNARLYSGKLILAEGRFD